MKKTRFFIATLLLVVAAVSVAVVSCKKEKTKTQLKTIRKLQLFLTESENFKNYAIPCILVK